MFDDIPSGGTPKTPRSTPPVGGGNTPPSMPQRSGQQPQDMFEGISDVSQTAPGQPLASQDPALNDNMPSPYPPGYFSGNGAPGAQRNGGSVQSPFSPVQQNSGLGAMPGQEGQGMGIPGGQYQTQNSPFTPVQGGMSQMTQDGAELARKSLSSSQKVILTVVAFLVLIVLVAGGFFLYVYFQNSSDDGVTTTNSSNTNKTNTNSRNSVLNRNSSINGSVTNSTTNTSVRNSNSTVRNTNATTNTNTANTNTTNTSSSNTNKTPSASSDLDQDGLTYQEEQTYKTDPNNPDTDGDSYLDGEEVVNGYNPNGPGKL